MKETSLRLYEKECVM